MSDYARLPRDLPIVLAYDFIDSTNQPARRLFSLAKGLRPSHTCIAVAIAGSPLNARRNAGMITISQILLVKWTPNYVALGWPQHMLDVVARNAPSVESVNDVMMGRRLVAVHAIKAVELAMEAAGGAGFYRTTGLERRFRDIQGARYHAMQPGPQAEYAGAMALGLPVDKIY